MRIYLSRHAIAAPRDARRYPDDSVRPLTHEGRRRMTRAARGLRTAGQSVDLILSSPLLRARQTAEILARACRPHPPIRIARTLSPGGRTAEILAGIGSVPRLGAVLLVGHEPDLSRLAGELLLDGNDALAIEFRKGGICRIDFEGAPRPGEGRLIFHLTPRILRRLGRPEA
ncbi:MAG TPA: phosphohistidine phosphatase SixA [Candidatus Polarisedimenticolia bacterium]